MSSDRREIVKAILARYASDPAFKKRLLDDPKGTLSDAGLLEQIAVKSDDPGCGGGSPTCVCTNACTGGNTLWDDACLLTL